MNFILDFVGFSLVAAAAVVLLLGLTALTRGKMRSAGRYLLWAIVVLRFCVPIGFHFFPAPISIEYAPAAQTQSADEAPAASLPGANETPAPQTADAAPAPRSETPDVTSTAKAAPDTSASVPAASDTPASVPAASDTPASVPVPPDTPASVPVTPAADESEPSLIERAFALASRYAHVIVIAYLSVAAAIFAFRLLAYAVTMRRVARTFTAPDAEALAVYGRVASDMGVRRVPELVVSDKTSSPMLCGFFRRRVVIGDVPMNGGELEGVFRHELTHHQRGDLYMKLAGALCLSLNFMNPAAYIAVRRMEAEMEFSCDERVLAGKSETERAAYGSALLDAVKADVKSRAPMTTRFDLGGKELKRRFALIMEQSGKRRGVALVALALALVLIAPAVISCTTSTASDEDVSVQSDETTSPKTASSDAADSETTKKPDESERAETQTDDPFAADGTETTAGTEASTGERMDVSMVLRGAKRVEGEGSDPAFDVSSYQLEICEPGFSDRILSEYGYPNASTDFSSGKYAILINSYDEYAAFTQSFPELADESVKYEKGFFDRYALIVHIGYMTYDAFYGEVRILNTDDGYLVRMDRYVYPGTAEGDPVSYINFYAVERPAGYAPRGVRFMLSKHTMVADNDAFHEDDAIENVKYHYSCGDYSYALCDAIAAKSQENAAWRDDLIFIRGLDSYRRFASTLRPSGGTVTELGENNGERLLEEHCPALPSFGDGFGDLSSDLFVVLTDANGGGGTTYRSIVGASVSGNVLTIRMKEEPYGNGPALMNYITTVLVFDSAFAAPVERVEIKTISGDGDARGAQSGEQSAELRTERGERFEGSAGFERKRAPNEDVEGTELYYLKTNGLIAGKTDSYCRLLDSWDDYVAWCDECGYHRVEEYVKDGVRHIDDVWKSGLPAISEDYFTDRFVVVVYNVFEYLGEYTDYGGYEIHSENGLFEQTFRVIGPLDAARGTSSDVGVIGWLRAVSPVAVTSVAGKYLFHLYTDENGELIMKDGEAVRTYP